MYTDGFQFASEQALRGSNCDKSQEKKLNRRNFPHYFILYRSTLECEIWENKGIHDNFSIQLLTLLIHML